MKPLNLCIDIDGTVTGAYDWLPRANDYFQTRIIPSDVTVYDIHEVLGVEREDYEKFYSIYGEKTHEENTIRDGVKEVISNLFMKHQIHFVTARSEKMKDVTNRWFTNHRIPLHSLSLLGSHNKVGKAIDLSCDIFIEDRYENAIQLAMAGFEVLLMDCYYNKGHLLPNITRVKTWYEIEKIINNHTLEQNMEFRIA